MSKAATNALKGLLLAAAVGALPLTVAHADHVLVGGAPESAFIDVDAQGFGAGPRLLTSQTGGFESGSVTPVNVPNGDAVSGADRSTQTLVAAPLPGAIFLFGSVLFGGLGMSARRARRRNRGAVSLLVDWGDMNAKAASKREGS